MKWYADNSELNGIKDAEIPDILLFGGIAISAEIEPILTTALENIKAEFRHPRAPVKWNFKDLRKLYSAREREDLYQAMLESSKEWRIRLIQETSDIDYKIIIACIESNSSRREILKKKKEELTRHAFSNGLMRFALHVCEQPDGPVAIVLDWPDKGDSKPFDTEYSWAYMKGITYDYKISYNSVLDYAFKGTL